ncbi:MAG TPA: extracellular solute-binding protein [Herbaspirillum sp.]|jgi:iron(III) transport system substrate-binding protein
MKKNPGVWALLLASMAGVFFSSVASAADPYVDNQAQVIAAAKKEGALTWYTSLAPGDSAQVIKRFEDKYGIKVVVWRSGDDNVLQRIVTEANGKNYKVDVAQIQTDNMEALSQEKLLATVNSPSYPDLVPGAVPSHHQWAIAQITLYVMAYNTNLIKKADLPKSYRDLQDPKWKGKLGMESTDSIWLHVVSESLGGDAGLSMFRQLKAKNDLSVRTGHSLLANLVAAGEVPLALNVYQYKAIQLKRGGAPVDWLALEPALAFTTSVGMLKNAPHPNAARLFYEFMLNDGQEVMASIDDIPSNTKVASPLKGTKVTFVDPTAALKNRQKWEDTFNDVIINR